VASKTIKIWKPSPQSKGEGSIDKLNWHRLFYSSGVIATAWWQGHTKQLEKPYLSREEISGEGKLYNQYLLGNYA